jgi:hypothetical protein
MHPTSQALNIIRRIINENVLAIFDNYPINGDEGKICIEAGPLKEVKDDA